MGIGYGCISGAARCVVRAPKERGLSLAHPRFPRNQLGTAVSLAILLGLSNTRVLVS